MFESDAIKYHFTNDDLILNLNQIFHEVYDRNQDNNLKYHIIPTVKVFYWLTVIKTK